MTRCRGLILGRWAKGRGIEALSQETGVCMMLGSAHSCMTKLRVAGTPPYEHPALARAWYGAQVFQCALRPPPCPNGLHDDSEGRCRFPAKLSEGGFTELRQAFFGTGSDTLRGGGCLRAFFGTLGASPRTTPLSLRGRDGAGSGPGGFSGGVQRVDHLTHCQIWRFAEWEMPPQGVGG